MVPTRDHVDVPRKGREIIQANKLLSASARVTHQMLLTYFQSLQEAAPFSYFSVQCWDIAFTPLGNPSYGGSWLLK
eukprot:545780-Pyramimonas_sp.AAC.1